MRIIRLAAALLLLSAAISSCGAAGEQRALFYQDEVIRISGVYTTPLSACGVELYCSPPDGSGERNEITLSYTSPEALSGLTFEKREGEVSARLDGMEISLTDAAAENALTVTQLFALPQKDITKIEKTDTGTRITVENTAGIYEIITDKNGYPEKITATEGGETRSLEIEKNGL